MPSRKTPKIKARVPVHAGRHKPARPKYDSASFAKKMNAKKSNPDIHVKKTAYSKAARAAVLASANARQQLIDMGGENTIAIIREFDKDMSDEELARKTGIKASDVRVVLNRLHSYGLFSYTRVRDKDSGWYSYIWRMSEGKLREVTGGQDEQGGMESSEETVEGSNYLQKNIIRTSNEPGDVSVPGRFEEEEIVAALARKRR